MVRIRDSEGRSEGSGYARIFGDPQLGKLISRVHATSIRAGTELEKMVLARVTLIPDLDEFLSHEVMADGVHVAPKRMVKDCETLNYAGAEPDLLVFKRREGKQLCHVIELKDGDAFDTKKSSAERQSLHGFIQRNASQLPYFVYPHFCCFNQDDRRIIYDGFKRKVPMSECMTGREFCELLEIDYDEIRQEREADQAANLDEFLEDLVSIPAVKQRLGNYSI
ncbi:MAG: hypothetical protein OXE05_08450 [Chloroflexi bacterium]|nr:hypothetical protein [Chloroflexota bacterium]